MKEQFVTKKINADAMALIGQVNEILRAYARKGYRLTLRQIYYQLVSTNPKPHKIRRFWFAIPLDLWPKIGPMLPAHVGCYTLAPQMWRGAPIGGLTVEIARPAPALPHGRKLTADERMDLMRLLALRFWDVEAKKTQGVPV